jgi:hypothetical protein
MSWKSFTPEELMAIRNNPYVKSATDRMIRFTVTFKIEFWEQYNDKGIPPTQIIRSMGFDTIVLGESRIAGIVQHIREQVVSGVGFTDVYHRSALFEPKGQNKAPSIALIHLQHEVAYMKQELEFIKKTILADREARRKCSSKQKQISSSESSSK